MSDLTEIGRLWPKRLELRAAYDATDDDGETDAIFVDLDRIEGEILRCQAVTVEDLQRQAEIVDSQNLSNKQLSKGEVGIFIGSQVVQLLQSIRGLPSIAGPSGVEQMCVEVVGLQEAINDCAEFKTYQSLLCADDTMRPLAHFALNVDRIATKRKDALVDLISTTLPTTLAEVQMMNLVLMEMTEVVTSDASPSERHCDMCLDLTVAIRDGLERLTGKTASDLGMTKDIEYDPYAQPRLPAERQRLKEAVKALAAWVAAPPEHAVVGAPAYDCTPYQRH